MELYLTPSITYDIYGYISWNDLRRMESVPDNIWKRVYEWYCSDPEFKKRISEYWFPNNIDFIPYKKYFLYFINMLIGQYKSLYPTLAPSVLYNDENFMLETIKYSGGALNELLRSQWRSSNKLIKSKYFLMKAVERGYDPTVCLQLLNGDRELAMMAIRKSIKCMMMYVSEQLKQDRELMLLAIQRDMSAFRFAPDTLRSDITFILEAVKINPYVFRYLDPSFKQIKEIVLEVVQNKGWMLNDVDSHWRSDRDIVMAAIKNEPESFKFANTKFRSDKEIMLLGIKEWQPLIRFLDPELKRDPDIISEMRKKCRTNTAKGTLSRSSYKWHFD